MLNKDNSIETSIEFRHIYENLQFIPQQNGILKSNQLKNLSSQTTFTCDVNASFSFKFRIRLHIYGLHLQAKLLFKFFVSQNQLSPLKSRLKKSLADIE